MTDFLTAKQLQDILRVDRTTIYRMADSGRLPGIKIGGQWRFSRQQIELWLQGQSGALPLVPAPDPDSLAPEHLDARQIFPLECVQLIQDGFADLLGAMLLLVDLEGNAITRPSHACGLHKAVAAYPEAYQHCVSQWVRMAQDPALTPKFQANALGLLCARGLVRVGSEIKAMLIVGDIAPEPWPPGRAELEATAARMGMPFDILVNHAGEVHHLDQEGGERALRHAQRVADIFAHIAAERTTLLGRLQRIAEITQV